MAKYQRYLILLLSFFAVGALWAQSPAGGTAGSAERRVSIVPLVNPGADYSGLFLGSGTQATALQLYAGSRKTVPLPKGSKDVVLSREATDPTTGKTGYVPVATVPWPNSSSSEALLIIGYAPNGKDLRAMILDDSLAAFPVETTRIVNLTGTTLLTKVINVQAEIRHGAASAPIPYPDVKKISEKGMLRYPYAFAVKPQGGELISLGSGFWEAAAGRRSLVIVQPPLNANSKNIRVRTVVDYPTRTIAAAANPQARR